MSESAGLNGYVRGVRSLLGAAFIASLFLFAGCGDGESDGESPSALAEPHLAEWSHAGANGPEKWAALDPAYDLCETGKNQSPIDIRGAVRRPFPPVRLDYAPEKVTMIDNGHAIEADIEEGASAVRIERDRFSLDQFHFHMPAEERIDGRSYAASIHLVHLSDDGRAAVVGLLVEPGPENPVIEELVEAIPAEPGETTEIEGEMDLADLVPVGGDAFRYQGSLTTPPCSEGISWTVFKEPVTMSREQLDAFAEAYPENARPIQPRNGREIRVGPGTA